VASQEGVTAAAQWPQNHERLFRYIEPFSSCFGFADLKGVDRLGDLPGAAGAAA
jgi:hypothetical protein